MSPSCTGRQQRRRRRKPRSRRRFHEYLGTLHSATYRDRATDGRPIARRPHRLSAAAGRGAAQRELSDAADHGTAARRRSADHGLLRGNAAGDAVRQIPGLTQMTSTSALGYTQITLQFDLSRDIQGCEADALSAIQSASSYLPKNLPYPPSINKVNPADTPILVLGLTSDTLPLTTVDAYAENILMQKISQISGVGLV